jgi:hypothetical protein
MEHKSQPRLPKLSSLKTAYWILWIVVSVGFYLLVFSGWKQWLYNHEFRRIHLGMSQQQILTRLGNPAQITDCTTTYGGFQRGQSEQPAPGCTQEYWYYSPIFPEGWSYTFDSQGKLIDSYHWVLP